MSALMLSVLLLLLLLLLPPSGNPRIPSMGVGRASRAACVRLKLKSLVACICVSATAAFQLGEKGKRKWMVFWKKMMPLLAEESHLEIANLSLHANEECC